MTQAAPAIDPSIAYLADAIERSALLQSAHLRLLMRQLQGYHIDLADPRFTRQALEEVLVGRNLLLGKE